MRRRAWSTRRLTNGLRVLLCSSLMHGRRRATTWAVAATAALIVGLSFGDVSVAKGPPPVDRPATAPPAGPPPPPASTGDGGKRWTSTWLPTGGIGIVVMALGALTLPSLSIAYLTLRLAGRKAALIGLFTQERIIERYLVMRGRRPEREPDDEPDDHYTRRLRQVFDAVFTEELQQQHSPRHFVLPCALTWFSAGLIVYLVGRTAFGPPLPVALPSGLVYALFGAFVWTLWTVIRAYTRNDLTPATLYWVFFRYVLAVGYGMLAATLFAPALADLGAFFIATLPISELLRFIGTRLSPSTPGMARVEGTPKLTEIQGIDAGVVQRLEDLDVHTAQDLAFSDPLSLMLMSNFSPKVLIDWMDQAFLVNYVGEGVKELRPRGIRGSIEMAMLYGVPADDPRVVSIAGALKITKDDTVSLINNLRQDNQLLLLWNLWGVFET